VRKNLGMALSCGCCKPAHTVMSDKAVATKAMPTRRGRSRWQRIFSMYMSPLNALRDIVAVTVVLS
jgi:hypothetical protein